ncbi:MAG: hypothetical protein NTW93_04175 [Phycisphaerae bacterium]|nr:hypothetical protein [Phycisphaerae bacterium]
MNESGTTTGKVKASSNLYTALLALACGAVAGTAGFVAYKCWFIYGTLLKIVENVR